MIVLQASAYSVVSWQRSPGLHLRRLLFYRSFSEALPSSSQQQHLGSPANQTICHKNRLRRSPSAGGEVLDERENAFALNRVARRDLWALPRVEVRGGEGPEEWMDAVVVVVGRSGGQGSAGFAKSRLRSRAGNSAPCSLSAGTVLSPCLSDTNTSSDFILPPFYPIAPW